MQNDTPTLREKLLADFKKMKVSDRIVEMATAKVRLEGATPGVENDEIQEARLTVELLSLPDQVLLTL